MYPARQATPSQQRGASAIVILLFIAMAALILLVAFKLYPIYYDQWQVMSIAESFNGDPQVSDLSETEIEKRFQLRLTTNGIRDVDFDESVTVEKDSENSTLYITVAYERRTNLYKNVDAIVVFEELKEITY